MRWNRKNDKRGEGEGHREKDGHEMQAMWGDRFWLTAEMSGVQWIENNLSFKRSELPFGERNESWRCRSIQGRIRAGL